MKRKNFNYFGLLMLFVLVGFQLSAQSTKNLVRKGNELFEQQKYQDAEVKYRKALEKKPAYASGIFNLGDAVYKEKNYKEASHLFSGLSKTAKSSVQKAHSFYNLGNSQMRQKQYGKSVDSYIQSLKLKPKDFDTKYNLAYARKMLKKQQQKKKQQKQNKNKNQNKNKKQKNKQNKQKDKNKQNNKQNKGKQKNQPSKGQQGDQKKNENQNKSPQISRQDAKRMLDALENNEKKTLHKLQRQKAKAVHAKSNVINW